MYSYVSLWHNIVLGWECDFTHHYRVSRLEWFHLEASSLLHPRYITSSPVLHTIITLSAFVCVRWWCRLSDDMYRSFIYRLRHCMVSRNSPATWIIWSLYEHLINATGSRIISCVCLLDLSATFDTIDHNILITCLSSWFSIHSTALNWFRSYLSSRCFCVKCNNDFSSPHTCLCGVPKAQFSALCSLSCTQPHWVLLFHLFL